MRAKGSTGRNNVFGYTLIELTVVLILVGLMGALAIPRFRYTLLTDDLKSTTRLLIGTIKNAKNDAVRDHKDLLLRIDLDAGVYWVESEDMTEEERTLAREEASTFPVGVRVMDVWLTGEGCEDGGGGGHPLHPEGVCPALGHSSGIRRRQAVYPRVEAVSRESGRGRDISRVRRKRMSDPLMGIPYHRIGPPLSTRKNANCAVRHFTAEPQSPQRVRVRK